MTRLEATVAIAAAGLVLTTVAVHSEETQTVRVRVAEDHVYGRVAYRYSIENNSRRPIVAFRLGEDPRGTRAELRQPPFGWTDEKGLPLGSAFAPDGWTVEAVREDDAALWFVEWFTSESDASLDVGPGQLRDGFSVVVFDAAAEYQTSSWTVVFDNGERVSGRLEPDQP